MSLELTDMILVKGLIATAEDLVLSTMNPSVLFESQPIGQPCIQHIGIFEPH